MEAIATGPVTTSEGFDVAAHRARAIRALEKASFATIATASHRNRPHVVGIRYAFIDRGRSIGSATTLRSTSTVVSPVNGGRPVRTS